MIGPFPLNQGLTGYKDAAGMPMIGGRKRRNERIIIPAAPPRIATINRSHREKFELLSDVSGRAVKGDILNFCRWRLMSSDKNQNVPLIRP
jgi:hypothetical protein